MNEGAKNNTNTLTYIEKRIGGNVVYVYVGLLTFNINVSELLLL